ncbi:hypothetical protein [Sphingomonas gilva]|nr:hypothetical protein [Sphingomonas gilva]
MKDLSFLALALIAAPVAAQVPERYMLVWAEEIDKDGAPDPATWV